MGDLVNVICIPCDDPEPRVLRLPLLSHLSLEPGPKESMNLEECLMHVPDIIGHCHLPFYQHHSGDKDWREHGWRYRSLINLGNMDPNETAPGLGPYYMYKGSNDHGNLLRNDTFKSVPGAAPVYGDVFIFKVKERGINEYDEAEYDILDNGSIKDAFNGKGIASHECLKWLSEQ